MLFFGARRCAHVNFDVKKDELFDSSGVGLHFESLQLNKIQEIIHTLIILKNHTKMIFF